MHHVDKYGIGKVVEMALDRINPHRDRPVLRPTISKANWADPFVVRRRRP